MTERHGFAWLASYPKSGNTWFRIFLAALRDDPGGLRLDRLGSQDSAAARGWLDAALPFATGDLTPAETEAVRPMAYRHHHARTGGVVKVHDAWSAVLAGDTVSRAIYLVRSPLDVAPSLAAHLGISIDDAIGAMASDALTLMAQTDRIDPQVPQHLSSWSGHVASWLDAPEIEVHRVRYEDMLASPAAAFGAALRFLGIDASPGRIEEAVERSRFGRLRDQEAAQGFGERADPGRRFFRRGTAGGWREILTPAQVARIIDRQGPTMRRLGYLDAAGSPLG